MPALFQPAQTSYKQVWFHAISSLIFLMLEIHTKNKAELHRHDETYDELQAPRLILLALAAVNLLAAILFKQQIDGKIETTQVNRRPGH